MNLNRSRSLFALPLLATISLAGASLVVPSAALASSDVNNPESPHKVFVCKYVGTPDVNERLKAGNNPISVDLDSINEYKTFGGDIDTLVGDHFADAQGRSFVLAVDRGQPTPPVSECPGYTPIETPTASPSETPSETPQEMPTASPSETPSDTPIASPSDTPNASPSASDPDATLTPGQVVSPTSTPSGAVDAIGVTPHITPPATDTAPAMAAGRDGNPAPLLLLLAAVTAVLALAKPRARGRGRRTR